VLRRTEENTANDAGTENRFEGTIGFLQISFPLWVAPHGTPPQPVVAKY